MKKLSQLSIVILVFGTMLFTSCTSSQDNGDKATTDQNTAKEENIDFEKAFIVDVRTPAEFKNGSFTGAVNIPLSTVEQNIQQFKGKEQVVVFCKSGTRAGKAMNILEENGISTVINGVNQAHLEELQGN